MAFQVPSIFTAIDKITAPTRIMKRGVVGFANATTNAMARVDRAAIGVGRSINSVTGGFGLLLGTTLAFTQAQAAVNTMANFETGLVGVGKTADIAGAELTQFGNSVIALSRSLNSVVGTEKLLEMSGIAGALGVKGSDNILKFSETLAKLETATDIVGEQGAASIARILNVTGDGIGVVDRFGAALVALGNNSAAAESEILGVANEVARATAPFNLGSQAVLGISAALKSVGVRAESGGSGVGKFFKALEEAVITGKNLQGFSKVLGLTQSQITSQFRDDPSKLFVPFISGLKRISDAGGSVAISLEGLGIGGEIAFKALAPLVAKVALLSGSMNLSSSSFKENVALQEEFLAASRTIASAINAVSNEFDNIINSTANANSGFSVISESLFFVKDNLGLVIKGVLGLGIAYVGLKTAAIGIRTVTNLYNIAIGIQSGLLGVSSLALKGNTLALGAQAVALKVSTLATRAFGIATKIAGGPIIWIITAIIALGVLIFQMIEHWDQWGAAASLALGPLGAIIAIIQSLRLHWDGIVDAFRNNGIVAGLKSIGLALIDAVLAPLQQVFKLLANIPGFGKGFEDIQIARALIARNIAALGMPPGVRPPSPAPALTGPQPAFDPITPLNPAVTASAATSEAGTDRDLQVEANRLAAQQISLLDQLVRKPALSIEEGNTDIDVSTERGFAF